MAHSTPTDITNKGDADRLETTAIAWILQLEQDERVEQPYLVWLDARAAVNQQFASLPEPELAVLAASYAALEGVWMARVLRDDLGLATARAAWSAPALAHFWECRVTGEKFEIPVLIPKETPIGKHPRDRGADIERNVIWLYRHTVRQPPESIHDLAREYEAATGRRTDARSVVRNGIAQARALLAIIDRDGLIRQS